MLINTGCTTTGGTSDGWVVVNPPERTPPPPPPKKKPPENAKKKRGQDQAGNNHLRSAYRFLEKNKADHALRELGKARYSLGNDFRVYYYMGGAYFYKRMYRKALDSWQTASRFTRDSRLRSRLRTCLAYALIHLEGDKGSIPYLRKAVDLDRENRHAMELLRGLENSRDVKRGVKKRVEEDPRHSSDSKGSEHSRYAEEMVLGRENTDKNAVKKRDDGNYYDHRDLENGKGDRKGQKKGRKDKKPDLDIRNLDQFKRYFLVRMF